MVLNSALDWEYNKIGPTLENKENLIFRRLYINSSPLWKPLESHPDDPSPSICLSFHVHF